MTGKSTIYCAKELKGHNFLCFFLEIYFIYDIILKTLYRTEVRI